MTDKELKCRCRRLAWKECPNYTSHECLDPDLILMPQQKKRPPCHSVSDEFTIEDGGITCDYFLFYVLPQDPELEKYVWNEINRPVRNAPWLRNAEMQSIKQKSKPCARCKGEYIPGSNRQKYCTACAKAVDQRNRARRAREKRLERAGA